MELRRRFLLNLPNLGSCETEVDRSFGGLVDRSNPEQLRNKLREECTKSIYFLARAVLGFRDLTPDLHLPVANFLQDPTISNRKLLILPRGHFKSTLMSIACPIWRLLPKHEGWEEDQTDGPNSRILLSGSTATNAEHFLRRIKAVFESNQLFQWLYPELIPDWTKVKKWTETEIQIPRPKAFPEASIETIGAGGKITGRHFTDMYKDDLIEVSIANSPDEMLKIIEWQEYSESLLEQPERDRDYMCGTRYAQNDLYGYVKDNDKRYVVYERKAIESGVPIFPQRFTLEGLGEMARRKPYIYSTQYMNNPIDPSIVDFKAKWLKYYKLTEKGQILLPDGKVIDPRKLNSYILVDPAISEKKSAARTAIVNLGVFDPEHIFVLHAKAMRINPYETITTVFSLAKILRPHKVGVETVAYQKALKFFMEMFSQQLGIYLSVEELKPGGGSKEARIRGLINYFASGSIWIREEFAELIEEYLSFPNGKFRDLMDALSYGPQIWSFPDHDEVSPLQAMEEEENLFAVGGRDRITGY
jgi:phage terminase large subunit-like protein